MPNLLRSALLCAAFPASLLASGGEKWVDLFNGKNIDGRVVKLAGRELGDNYGYTFRLGKDGVIQVSYD